MKFIKKEQLQLVNGGYLSDSEKAPVTNHAFVDAQKRAEFVVKFAEVAKTKDFKGKKADDLESVKREVLASLSKEEKTSYFPEPTAPSQDMTDALTKEAMAFLNFQNEKEDNKKLNEFMQEFNVLNEFEKFGLFFVEGIVKLNKIYTVQEVKDAILQAKDLI